MPGRTTGGSHMKRSFYLLTLASAYLLAAATSWATSDVRLRFHVSFPFMAGSAALPAGSYTITEDASGHAFIFPAQGGKRAAILLMRLANVPSGNGRASVSFVERGSKYYLDTVNLLDGAAMLVER